MAQLDGSASKARKISVAQDDAIIANGLNAGLRRLVVRALVHSAGKRRDQVRMDELLQVLSAEIGRLTFKAETGDGADADFTVAVRSALMILLNAAARDARSDLARAAESMQ